MSKADTCVCCGRVIPENSHYCVICGMGIPKKQRQIDRIRNMSVEDLASFICSIYDYEYESPIYKTVENGKHICGTFIPDYDEDSIKQYLESEATE